MTRARHPLPARLFASLLIAPEWDFNQLEKLLVDLFGECEYVSDTLPFDVTDYYEAEMGSGLLRRFYSFRELVARERLAEIKLTANELEDRFTVSGKRTINLDPGLITPENLILATCKNFSHRIYLGSGVFGDLTLIYNSKHGFQTLPWTYFDYGSEEYLKMFKEIRARYMKQLKTEKGQDL
jgi:Domain of unknown function (DUF4416)